MSDDFDPNSGLFGDDDEKSDEEKSMDYVFGKNPNRVSAMNELWYEEMKKRVDDMNLPSEEAKLNMIFKLTAGGVLDMLGDSQPPDCAPDVMSDFDVFMGVALTNKRFNVNLFAEQQKALKTLDREKFHDDEEYLRALSDAEDAWWDIAQPMLDGRNPNDAIKETLAKYGLNE